MGLIIITDNSETGVGSTTITLTTKEGTTITTATNKPLRVIISANNKTPANSVVGGTLMSRISIRVIGVMVVVEEGTIVGMVIIGEMVRGRLIGMVAMVVVIGTTIITTTTTSITTIIATITITTSNPNSAKC